ncbi:MAG: hypothetical protein U0518_03130 [Candidatus Gracilibacteria bacterium]
MSYNQYQIMRKISFSISLALCIFILSGCSNNDKLFERKKECTENKDRMMEQLLELGKVHGATYIDEIFYSKEDNTCYYTAYGTNGYLLFDYFGNKFTDGASNTNSNDIQRLKKKIIKLKGE